MTALRSLCLGFLVFALLPWLSACNGQKAAPSAELSENINAVDPSPQHWWRSAVIYEILVRSFQDSDGDGIGDFDGVTSRLDYLEGLGVTGLWLMPIFKSPTYHGYDVTDYKSINPNYGTIDSFKRLVAAAHSHGIKLILDIPLNHSSNQHPWFLASASSPSSPLRSRYVWRSPIPNWSALPNNPAHWHALNNSNYYAFFSGKMPDLNWDDPTTFTDIMDALQFWVQLGVDGFRLDAARYLAEGPNGESDTPATHALWQRIVAAVKTVSPETMFVGEVWAGQGTIDSYGSSGHELDQCFAFPLSGSLTAALTSGSAAGFTANLARETASSSPKFFSSPFVSNHDQTRIATVVNGDQQKLKLASVALLTLPGTPYIYYGEEIGLPNGTGTAHSGDLAKRTPMPWEPFNQSGGDPGRGFSSAPVPWLPFATNAPGVDVQSQEATAGSLYSTYKQLIALRKQQPALVEGDTEILGSTPPGISAYVRRVKGDAVLVVLNFGGSAPARFTVQAIWGAKAAHVEVLYGNLSPTVSVAQGKVAVAIDGLPASAGAVMRLTP